jgi:hypothetical protein
VTRPLLKLGKDLCTASIVDLEDHVCCHLPGEWMRGG